MLNNARTRFDNFHFNFLKVNTDFWGNFKVIIEKQPSLLFNITFLKWSRLICYKGGWTMISYLSEWYQCCMLITYDLTSHDIWISPTKIPSSFRTVPRRSRRYEWYKKLALLMCMLICAFEIRREYNYITFLCTNLRSVVIVKNNEVIIATKRFSAIFREVICS